VSLLGLDDRVYRHHCRELIGRAKRGADTRPATDAEVMAALSAMSLRAPLGSTAASLYEELFRRVMGRRVAGPSPREPWTGAKRELLDQMRRRLATEGRK
jgi:hypothetical protein